jgi:hypothetical protein
MKIPSKQRILISKFIQSIGERNFADANENMKALVNEKIKTRIKTAATKPLF